MKIFFRIHFLAFFCLCFFFSYAQKSALSKAFNHLKYDELEQAKKIIDAAIVNYQTESIPKTWYYRGLIYQAIYNHPVFSNLDSDPLSKSFDSFKKCRDLDSKLEFSEDAYNRMRNVMYFKGADDYKNKKYKESLVSFDYLLNLNNKDTTALLYSAYAADYLGLYNRAILNYGKLISLDYTESDPEKSNIYLESALLTKTHLSDTAGALNLLEQGRKKYPDALNLIREEASLLIAEGKYTAALNQLEVAISRNQSDSNLHLVLASVYENLANPKDASGKNGTKNAQYSDYLSKAEEHYRRAIDLKQDYFEAYYNLGAMFFNQGAELIGAANNYKSDSEFKTAKKSAEEKLKQSLPYLEKALELSPNDKNTLISLRQIYIRTGDTEKYNRVKTTLSSMQ